MRDESGALLGAVFPRSSQYLSRPEPHRSELRNPTSVERQSDGLLVATYEAIQTLDLPSSKPEPIDLQTARVVTFDLSVPFAGIDPSKFGPDDVIFVSAALALDIAVIGDRRPGHDVHGVTCLERGWELTTPVPVDSAVIAMYQRLCSNRIFSAGADFELDRTDLLCAAAAIVYEAPLYTTKPKAYERLKNGLTALQYGPKRSTGDPAVTRALSPAHEALRDRYDAGQEFDEDAEKALLAARYDGNDFVEVLIHILEDDNLDPSWRVGVLRKAKELRGSVYRCLNRPDLFDAVSVLAGASGPRYDQPADPLMAEQRELANQAIGAWGRWPQDAHEDVLRDMERDPRSESSLTWFRRYLQMASVSSDVADAEVLKASTGEIVPTSEYIDSLQRDHGWA